MTRCIKQGLAAMALCLAASFASAGTTEPAVAVSTDSMSTHLARQVQTHAEQGLTALRRYIERTRFIHQLRLEYVVKQAAE